MLLPVQESAYLLYSVLNIKLTIAYHLDEIFSVKLFFRFLEDGFEKQFVFGKTLHW